MPPEGPDLTACIPPATSDLIGQDQRCEMRLAAAVAPEGWESKSAAAALMPCASCCAARVPHL